MTLANNKRQCNNVISMKVGGMFQDQIFKDAHLEHTSHRNLANKYPSHSFSFPIQTSPFKTRILPCLLPKVLFGHLISQWSSVIMQFAAKGLDNPNLLRFVIDEWLAPRISPSAFEFTPGVSIRAPTGPGSSTQVLRNLIIHHFPFCPKSPNALIRDGPYMVRCCIRCMS
jgi:hypothetical protein